MENPETEPHLTQMVENLTLESDMHLAWLAFIEQYLVMRFGRHQLEHLRMIGTQEVPSILASINSETGDEVRARWLC